MPIPLSSTAISEKNKIANSDSVFLLAMEIDIPSLEAPIRVVANTDNITWRGETWIAFPFDIDEISDTDAGEVPRVDVRVGNVNREMEGYIHDYDAYVKEHGPSPITCDLYVLNSLDLESGDPVVHHVFELIQPRTNPQWATFTLGATNPWVRRFPHSRLVTACQWRRFKGVGCDYDGPETECDRSLNRCRELENSHRFRGFYATGR